jgi:uridine phosphorylase
MPDRRAIVNPVKGKKPPDTGTMAIIAATEVDLRLLARLTDTPIVEQRKLYMSTLQVHADDHRRFTLAGPIVGAPYAAMIVESLWVWGVKTVLFIGWCGAVSRRIKAGDIILPENAMVDEGTSGHYCDPSCHVALPARTLVHQARLALQHHGAAVQEGAVWTTDAIFPGNRRKSETLPGKRRPGRRDGAVGRFHGGRFSPRSRRPVCSSYPMNSPITSGARASRPRPFDLPAKKPVGRR